MAEHERNMFLAIVEIAMIDPNESEYRSYLIAAPDQTEAEHLIQFYPGVAGGQIKRVWKLADNVARVWGSDGSVFTATPAAPAPQDEIAEAVMPEGGDESS